MRAGKTSVSIKKQFCCRPTIVFRFEAYFLPAPDPPRCRFAQCPSPHAAFFSSGVVATALPKRAASVPGPTGRSGLRLSQGGTASTRDRRRPLRLDATARSSWKTAGAPPPMAPWCGGEAAFERPPPGPSCRPRPTAVSWPPHSHSAPRKRSGHAQKREGNVPGGGCARRSRACRWHPTSNARLFTETTMARAWSASGNFSGGPSVR